MDPQPLADMPVEKLTLVERRHEYGDVYTYLFTSAHPIPYEAGQYAHVRLYDMPADARAVHELSFASAPYEEMIWFGIDSRSHSAYQQKLLSLNVGDQIGVFKIKRHMAWPPQGNDAVMIASGVGITPMRSFLADSRHTQLPLTTSIVHIGREHFLYGEELKKLAGEYKTATREELPEVLADVALQHPRAAYYAAGSSGFVETVVDTLTQCGIMHIESDAFKGLPE